MQNNRKNILLKLLKQNRKKNKIHCDGKYKKKKYKFDRQYVYIFGINNSRYEDTKIREKIAKGNRKCRNLRTTTTSKYISRKTNIRTGQDRRHCVNQMEKKNVRNYFWLEDRIGKKDVLRY